MRNFICISLLIISPFNAVAEEPRIIERSSLSIPYVALTFDACPTRKKIDFDEKLVKTLIDKKVSATFFMSGRWVKKNRTVVKQLAEEPLFEIGNHGFNHPHMKGKKGNIVNSDLSRTQLLIKEVTGKTPKYFRPPYGEVDKRVAKIASSLGLITIQYDIESGDPNSSLSKKRLIRRVLSEAEGGSIIVFHMNRNGLHTAEALPEIIDGLRSRGFALVTIDELLRQEQIAFERIKNLLAVQKRDYLN